MTNIRNLLLAKLLLGTATVVLVCLIAGFAFEARYEREDDEWRAKQSKLATLLDRYAPFNVKHIHPVYLFFFARDTASRRSSANEVVSVDAQGFRGPGPQLAGSKKLAFLVGSSTAFGFGSSSNETTISGYLNTFQSEYHFVNAAYPGWVSTQELQRIAHQLVDFKPALVVVMDGVNDIVVPYDYLASGHRYDVGTPESFDVLDSLVGNIAHDASRDGRPPWYRRWYPKLSDRWFGRMHEATPLQPADDLPRRITDTYARNLMLMNAMCNAVGARFVAVFEPFHRQIADQIWPFVSPTHALIVGRTYGFEFYDFANLFERRFGASLPVALFDQTDLDENTIFIDPIHLTDRGAKVIAEELWQTLVTNPQRRAPN